VKQYNIFGLIDEIEYVDNQFKIIKIMIPKTQKDEILLHLITYRTITSYEAIKMYNITRLADKIYQLRKEGFNITSTLKKFTNKYGNTSNYSIYKFAG
jgi:hypothetical protein